MQRCVMIEKSVKNQTIKETRRQTIERHKNMRCCVYIVKIVANKMNRMQKASISTLFQEAMWMYNYIIGDFKNARTDISEVLVKNGDEVETKQFTLLGSQIKQSIYEEAKTNIKVLSTNKQHGHKTGHLKFKLICNSVPLKEFGRTYKVNMEKQTIKLPNIKKPFKVRGLKQIPQNAEFANASLVRKVSGLYFFITIYKPYEERTPTGINAGLDFGIKNNITTSDGTIYNISVPPSKGAQLSIKRMNKSLSRNGCKKTKNHNKRAKKVGKSRERDANKRKDCANKIIHDILEKYDIVAIQDELLHSWHSGRFGKQVQRSAMGTIKARLKRNPRVITIESSFPSTQKCPACGALTKIGLSDREYKCNQCNYYHPNRDMKAALIILKEAEFRIKAR